MNYVQEKLVKGVQIIIMDFDFHFIKYLHCFLQKYIRLFSGIVLVLGCKTGSITSGANRRWQDLVNCCSIYSLVAVGFGQFSFPGDRVSQVSHSTNAQHIISGVIVSSNGNSSFSCFDAAVHQKVVCHCICHPPLILCCYLVSSQSSLPI